jgi:hypothetical protein
MSEGGAMQKYPPGRAGAGVLAGSAALALALAAHAFDAAALNVNVKPVNGATYAGTAHRVPVSMTVSRDGRSVTINMRDAPAYCSGGSGPEPHHAASAPVSSSGGVVAKLMFYANNRSRAKLATVVVKGNFFTFQHSKPGFAGSVVTSYASASLRRCSGEEPFHAVTR